MAGSGIFPVVLFLAYMQYIASAAPRQAMGSTVTALTNQTAAFLLRETTKRRLAWCCAEGLRAVAG